MRCDGIERDHHLLRPFTLAPQAVVRGVERETIKVDGGVVGGGCVSKDSWVFYSRNDPPEDPNSASRVDISACWASKFTL